MVTTADRDRHVMDASFDQFRAAQAFDLRHRPAEEDDASPRPRRPGRA
jgi:hypothetical protein